MGFAVVVVVAVSKLSKVETGARSMKPVEFHDNTSLRMNPTCKWKERRISCLRDVAYK